MFSPVKLMADRLNAKIEIGDDTRIHGTCIHAQERIIIGSRCLIAANCQIVDNSGHDLSGDNPSARIITSGMTKPILIEDDVWIGTGVIVLPGSRIGRGSVIGAGSVVSGNIPAMSLAVGAPCRVRRRLN
jgi:acetyltransferase-like isoleucine patch superfamily enzyme